MRSEKKIKGERPFGLSPFAFYITPLIILIPVGVNVEQQTNEYHVCDEGGAAVAHERQRQARDGHDADGHADVDKNVEEENGRQTDSDQAGEAVFGLYGNGQGAP